VIGSTVGGRLMSKVTHYKRVALIATPFSIAALMTIALAPAQLDAVAIGALMFVTGAGLSPSFPITTVSVQNAVLPWQLGTVTGVINFMRALTSALLVALYGAFLFGGRAQGLTLEQLATGHDTAALAGHFRWIFAAAALCLALSWSFLLAMEERPLKTGAMREGELLAVPAE
jgi:MFS family permease